MNWQKLVEFGPSVKVLNGKSEEIRSAVETKNVIFNKSYGFNPILLANSTQYKNSIS